MAQIPVERKSPSIWPWLIGLLVLIGLIWLLYEWFDRDEEVVPAAAVTAPAPEVGTPPAPAVTPPPAAEGPVTLATLLGGPAPYVGKAVSLVGQPVRVADVPSDRGFWVEDQGQRMFVVLNEGPPGVADVQGKQAEKPKLRPGDMIEISRAVVHDPTHMADIPGPLEQQTQDIVKSAPAFLTVQVDDIKTTPAA